MLRRLALLSWWSGLLIACGEAPTSSDAGSGSGEASSGGPSSTSGDSTDTTGATPTTGTSGDPGTSTTTGATTTTTTTTSTGPGTTTDATTGGPEGALRFNHLQALGTHNSYHISPGPVIKQWDYTHRPLAEQLGMQGVRKFELDLYFNGPGEPIDVYHVEILDTGSTCETLVDCLMALKTWSDAHLDHHPLYLMLELKSGFNANTAEDMLLALEDQILSVWPIERLLVPDEVQGAAANLRDGVAATGWPAIDALRGKMLIVMHDGGEWRDAYTKGGNTTAGRLLFPDAFGELDAPFAAVHSINDPIADLAKIQAAVDAGHLVRTRADADNAEPSAGDTTRATAALMSGAHFISTDYPPPMGDKYDYVVEVPGGTPSRCNPRTAPPGCTSEAVEDPLAVGP